MNKEQTIQETQDKINELYEKYNSNPYIFSKIHNYIVNLLPNILEKKQSSHEESLQRIESLSQEQNMFIETFLNTNKYFYLPSTEKFFFYDGLHYQIYNEDDILYNVLSAITKDRNLMSWKQMTKVYIMKRIKQNSLLKSIPESDTIQFVLDSLCPSFFSSKTEAKYFLTILGDNIFKKNGHLIHFIDGKAKRFISELTILAQSTIGLNLSQTFKYKYHEQHEYKDCRLVKINDCIKSESVWSPILNQCLLDLLCVACHYSIRFSCSDDVVLKHYREQHLIDDIFYLKDTEPEGLVSKFADEYLQFSDENTTTAQITWKNMQYLWKHFLESKHLPTVIFQQRLKGYLIKKMDNNYNIDNDIFTNVYSKFLPTIQQFLQFWNENIEQDSNETDFEIEDIVHLFYKWTEDNNDTHAHLNDKQIIDLLSYYYPDCEVEKDKYITGIRCKLWDKQLDIQVALESMREIICGTLKREQGDVSRLKHISIYDAYAYYCKYFSCIPNKRFVNKSYFEKYVFENLTEYILDEKFIKSDWILL
uniref:Uncharacterized protein n=1 Tax=viral metagenome TaxID=1070528 RepID=A0A6C0B8M8_9ZZZZ